MWIEEEIRRILATVIIGDLWVSARSFLTDPSPESRGCDCVAGLECLLNIIRALRMGSCLSAESRSPLPGSPASPGLGVRKRKNSKRRQGSRNSSFDYRREEPLHRIPGRMFLNGSSDVASLFTQQGKKGTNQDAMIVWEVSFFLVFVLLFILVTILLKSFMFVFVSSIPQASTQISNFYRLTYLRKQATFMQWQFY